MTEAGAPDGAADEARRQAQGQLKAVLVQMEESIAGLHRKFEGLATTASAPPPGSAEGEDARGIRDSLFRIHDTVLRKVQAIESGGHFADTFVLNLLEHVEGELKRNGITIVRPEPGADVDWKLMEAVEAVDCPFFRRDGTVARVVTCGFHPLGDPQRLFRKGQVVVYRKK